MKRTIVYTVTLVVILASVFLGRYLILDRARPVSLKFNQISYVVAKSLQGSTTSYLPIEGRDYNLGQIHYFDNNQWAVVSIAPIGSSLNSETLVLNKQLGSYKTVYGPSNFFLPSELTKLPSDVAKYLTSSVGKSP